MSPISCVIIGEGSFFSSLSNCQLFSSLSSWRSIGDFSPSILLYLLLSLFGSFFFRQAHYYNIMYIAWCLSLKTKAPSRLSWTFWYLFLYSTLFLRLLNFNPMIFSNNWLCCHKYSYDQLFANIMWCKI